MNRVTLLGRLTRDIEVRYTQTGKSVASFSVAVDRIQEDKSKEKVTDFIDCIAWGILATSTEERFFKGNLIMIEGRLQIRSYEKDGVTRRVAEVVANNICEPMARWEAK